MAMVINMRMIIQIINVGRKFYVPSENGYEKNIREYFDKIKN